MRTCQGKQGNNKKMLLQGLTRQALIGKISATLREAIAKLNKAVSTKVLTRQTEVASIATTQNESFARSLKTGALFKMLAQQAFSKLNKKVLTRLQTLDTISTNKTKT